MYRPNGDDCPLKYDRLGLPEAELSIDNGSTNRCLKKEVMRLHLFSLSLARSRTDNKFGIERKTMTHTSDEKAFLRNGCQRVGSLPAREARQLAVSLLSS